jgi:uncharacterized protein YdhG (YjbR/CyaY superfamily)
MAKTPFETPDQYIQTFSKEVQQTLQLVRQTIQKAVPGAEEVISYNIPAFKKDGWIFYYSAYKNHYSLSCPPPFTVFDEFKKELAGYSISKSTIQFPYDQPVPVKLISDMAKYRAKQNAEKVKKAK